MGQSRGDLANEQLSVNLSIMHPRLLSTLILIEPVILDGNNAGPNPALFSTIRRDIWETRAKAESTLRKAFAAWDQRALESFLQYGLRAVPTAIYDTSLNKHISPESVTLTTSKHQEAWAYAQVNFEPKQAGLDRLLLPDWDPVIELPHLASRPECLITMRNLPYIRPSVLYVFGAKSPLSLPVFQEKKVRMTGIGVGGNGGVAEAKVEKEVLQGSGHLVVFEKPDEAASVTAGWIQRWLEQWLAEEKILCDHKSKKSDDSMLRMSQLWVDTVKLPVNTSRPKVTKL